MNIILVNCSFLEEKGLLDEYVFMIILILFNINNFNLDLWD